ncbi:MAG: DUF4330 domain-containing protein [Monoglobales bacterium]
MIIDEKGRLFSKVSIVDIAIVIFIICAAAFVGLKFLAPVGTFAGAEQVNCEYTFKVQNVRQASVDALKKSVGENAYDSTGVFLGTVKEVKKVEPYMVAVKKTDGTMALSESPDKFSIEVSVEVSGIKTVDSIMVSNKRELSVGSHLSISTPEIVVETVITEINVKK